MAREQDLCSGDNYINNQKKRFNMDWPFGLGGLFFGGSSLYLFFQQIFLASLISFIIAVYLTYMFEVRD